MNPINNFQFIDFNYNITEIIQKSFEETEQLEQNAIMTFFKVTPKKINNFNHMMDKFVLSYEELPYNPEFVQLQNDITYAKQSKNEELLKSLKTKM